jgi:hypothetical protein
MNALPFEAIPWRAFCLNSWYSLDNHYRVGKSLFDHRVFDDFLPFRLMQRIRDAERVAIIYIYAMDSI